MNDTVTSDDKYTFAIGIAGFVRRAVWFLYIASAVLLGLGLLGYLVSQSGRILERDILGAIVFFVVWAVIWLIPVCLIHLLSTVAIALLESSQKAIASERHLAQMVYLMRAQE